MKYLYSAIIILMLLLLLCVKILLIRSPHNNILAKTDILAVYVDKNPIVRPVKEAVHLQEHIKKTIVHTKTKIKHKQHLHKRKHAVNHKHKKHCYYRYLVCNKHCCFYMYIRG